MTDPYAAVLADLQAQRQRIDIAIAAIQDLRPNGANGDLHLTMEAEEGTSPAPPLRPKRIIPTDPEELRLEAVRMMDAGFGMNEVKEQLELTEPQAQQFFFGK